MQVSAPDRDQLRQLAELRLDRPLVLSLYLNLDPSEFATPPARKTAVRSLLDEAERRFRDANGLSHDDRMAAPGDRSSAPATSSRTSCRPRARTASPCSRASRPASSSR